MKTNKKLIIGLIVAIAVMLPIVYQLANTTPSADLPIENQVTEIIESSGCLSCHSMEPVLPFYSKLPIAGEMVQQDAAKAVEYLDMTPTMEALRSGQAVNEATLAMIESSIVHQTMPPAKYYLVHWGSSINDKEKEILLNWVSNTRATHYSTALATDAFTNDPVQPIVDAIEVDTQKVGLGNILFHDTRLSADNTLSCASCHGLNTGGCDNKQYSEGIEQQFGGVNAPTVYNAYFNFVQFWDGRAQDLAAQAAGPPLNPIEMGSLSFDDIIAKLQADPKIKALFTRCYPDQGITEATITHAIAEFEKTLITPNSPFDRYLKGDPNAITDNQKKGYELFKANNCATCHVGQNMGGQSYEKIGLFADYFEDRGTEILTEDHGRYKQTQKSYDDHRFKVPSLRNITLTYPYFHDGRYADLKSATEAMAKFQCKNPISTEQIDLIVDFMNSLTGQYKGQSLSQK